MTDKKIYRYSNVELIDLIKNGINKGDIKKAKSELESRNLTPKQQTKLESEYIKHKEFQDRRKQASLTTSEWMSFFFLSSFIPKPRWRDDHFSKSELERYRKYGFETKEREAQKAKLYGSFFWILMIICSTLVYGYLTV
ncbi:hypothetical protein [Aquimarina sp. MMG016]|uniref:hypothetical protein n=1 Tax=Aquimarina sp. MMG016 TaxID=2822690 RepID=UPI001B3A55DF|nr:hypothetical protein [Aquimarina sp. MMG016]MBQ4820349.1 hypothetical protein [Aquimarina sp. MMG016]